MKIHTIPITIIVMALIVIGLVSFLTNLSSNYNVETNTGTIDQLSDKFEYVTNETIELKNKTLEFIPEEGELGLELPYKFLKFGWQVIRTYFVAIFTLGGMVEILGNSLAELGVPLAKEIVSTIVAIIILITVAIIGYGLYKWKFES